MDRPGVRLVPEGSGEQRKMAETGCDVICGAPTNPMVKGYVKVKVKQFFFLSGVLLMHAQFYSTGQDQSTVAI